MGFFLKHTIDWNKHNEEVRALYKDYSENKHKRIPVSVVGSIRNLLSNPDLNKTGYSFPDFFTNAEAHLKCQLEYQYYVRHNILCDQEMGMPEKHWQIGRMDFQNSYDQAWFGCPMCYFGPEDVPDTGEILKEKPELLYEMEDPDPFMGRGDFMEKAMEMYKKIHEICKVGYEFHGLPVKPPPGFQMQGTDGLFSVALKLRGTVECMTDMYENPEYFHALMDYITRNTIKRMKAHREWIWKNTNEKRESHKGAFGYADDSIAMLSPGQFREFILPYQKRLYAEFHDGSRSHIHLCGDATHHFKFLADTFNVGSFDTGFPVNHGKLRKELGPEIEIRGGPTIMLVKDGSSEQIDAEVKRICSSGVMDGKRFILIAANNLAPCTPVENIVALYDAGRKHGTFC
ncbi:MAG: hypothetical protein A2017_11375 [Lentisphaerae bacterium GWF2_44_16]|nr:MAG: hypothetical protein A2017_11375 [Lentisphaerae bacterium GWF2_44_16]